MKKFITIFCLFICVFPGVHDINAQSKNNKKEKILTGIVEKADKWGIGGKIPGWSLIKAKATGKKSLLGLSLGYGNLGLTDFGEDISFDGGTQWSIRLKIIFYQNHHFSIHTGLGYESDIFKFSNMNFTDNNGNSFLSDGKMVARYFTIPLQFKYKLSKSLSVHAGFIGGLNFNTSHTGEKFIWEKDDIDYTARKEFKDFNPFKLDFQTGITLYHITFYLKHGLLDSFKSESSLSAHSMSWGISLGI